MKGKKYFAITLFMAGALIALLSGCSADNSVDSQSSNNLPMNQPAFLVAGDPVQFSALVATTDPDQRLLTFVDISYTVFADTDCEIVVVEQGVETAVEFEYIQVGDSIQVCGVLQENGNIKANRIRIFTESDCPDYDLSFRDIITSIDYSAGTFTVSERSETIATDENTVIWTVSGGKVEFTEQEAAANSNTSAKVVVGNVPDFRHVVYAFADLNVGDIVEVKANVIDPSNLMAVSIKLAGSNFKQCVAFDALIASLDCETRIVTFVNFDWIGWVCPGAVLTGSDGLPLDLCGFVVGNQVSVQGYPLEGDTLKVCLLEQL